MPSVKTAVSFPSDLLAEVDSHAAESGESRSAFLQEAARRYLADLEETRLSARIREAYGSPEVRADDEEFIMSLRKSTHRAVLRETEW